MLVPNHYLALLALNQTAFAFSPKYDFAAEIYRVEDDVPAGFTAPPYYPAPKGGWLPSWSAAYAKAQKVVTNMTLPEKVNLTTGTGLLMGPCVGNTGSALRFGIPNLCLQDSALGIAATDNVTAFPAGITTGATFSKALMLARGGAIGQEARGKGVNIQLGPAVGPIGRKPARSETIKGIQANGVIATIKHWIGNEQEMYRMDIPPHGLMKAISSNIDDRTLHELYGWPFMDAIKVGVGAVMTSYNDINGSAASQNSKLINGILKDEYGFQGLVMTDWLAHIGGVSSTLAGLDMSMPGDGAIPLLGVSYWGYDLSTSVLNGTIPLDRLNDMVTRIVAAWFQFGQDKDFPLPNFSGNTADRTGLCYPGALFSPSYVVNEYVNVQANHKTIAREVVREGITLLKNSNKTLPLSTSATLKVFGSHAQNNPDGINACSQRNCNKGVLGMGWGSGTANYPYIDAPIDAIKRNASTVTYYSGDSFPSSATVAAGDIAIVFITSDSGENQHTVEGNNGDRSSNGLIAWHNGDALVKAAAAKYATVIVVVNTVGPIIMESWADLPSVKSIVVTHLPGQEAGDSLTDILFGDYSPSGHLPYSIPKAESDYPDSVSLRGFAFFQVQDTFEEGLYIDYRYLNKHSITPRYSFGHGLTYTAFSHTDLTIRASSTLTSLPPTCPPKGSTPVYSTDIPPAAEAAWPAGFDKIWRYLYPYLDNPTSIAATKAFTYPVGYSTTPQPDPPAGGDEGGNPALWDTMFTISVTVTNTGSMAGKDVVMAFLQHPSDSPYDTPIIQLRNFEKTDTLTAGGKQTLQLTLTRRDLSVWDVVKQNWVIPISATKPFLVWVGSSSANLTAACDTISQNCSGGRAAPVVS
ncbi:glycoside hydrolase superfamily [Amylocarpus encephaloides]|uniref:beta-glucosidase n=1 Tax=Amylocarpus encephaloides TaxID=45428 RepID=A0A9P8C3W3_9HELO|nr:glycoside hydrolase superfamily [Amylocarpus encephaloides]